MTKKPTRLWISAIVAAALVAGVSPARAQTETAPQQIVGLSFLPHEGSTTIVLEAATTPLNYTYYSADPYTIVVDVIGASASGVAEVTSVQSAEVKEVRVVGAGVSGSARFEIAKSVEGSQTVRLEGTRLYVEVSSSPAPPRPSPDAGSGALPDGSTETGAAGGFPPSSLEKAFSLLGLSYTGRGEAVVVDIRGDGYLLYHDFVLDEPNRLVIDFKDVVNDLPHKNFAVNQAGVAQIRTSQFQESPERIARVVFDLEGPTQYSLAANGDSLRVVLGSQDDVPAQDPGPALGSPDLLKEDTVELTDPGLAPPAFSGALLPYEAAPQAAPSDAPAVAAGSPGANPYDTRVVGGAGGEYEGELISLDFKDADIKDVLRFFSEISGLNIILDPEVTGNVTVRLTEVPWDQALDIILKNQGFGKDLKGNVLRIAPHTKLAREEADERRFKEEQELNVDIITTTRPISYAKASNVKTILDQIISRRGSIIVDDRTNTLVIREVDVTTQQRAIRDLINTLDQPTPQVEIEARIIETTKQWEQALGIQWGFSGIASAKTGTTTDLAFPNNYKINGDLLPGEGGFASELPNSGWAVNLPATSANSGIGLQFGNILDTVQLDIAISAAESDGQARTLSAPKITTQNNQNASIESGFQIPIQTTANQTTTVTFVSASLQLNVTPQITADNTIIMNIQVAQNFPNFSLAILTGGNAPINTRRAATQVLVPDGATTVIGGIFQFSEDNSQSKVPFFSKLPVLGYLFKNTEHNRQNTELLIFITPRIKKLQR